MKKLWLILFAVLFPIAVWAQSAAEISEEVDDDRGFITRFLERNLSGAGRQVVLRGFQGALSSRATFQELSIADDDGVWLTITDGAMQWNRAALLRGRVDIAELTAGKISLPRLPAGESTPTAEATEFALPELPVGIEIEQIRADRVELGETVIGVAAAISLDGNMSLAGGEGNADLTINRLDGPRGQFVLDAGYVNETQNLRVNLALDEAADGLLVNLVNLYDKPSVSAQISGEGVLKDFAADIRLATSGQPRVTGTVSANGAAGPDGSPGTRFSLNLGGDVATLLPPENRAFFGPESQLVAQGWRGDDGRISLPELRLDTEALRVDGELEINDQGAPQTANLMISLGRDAEATELPVVLPFGGQTMTVDSGRVQLQYDAAEGQGWTLTGRIGQFDQGDLRIGELTLDGAGEVLLEGGALRDVSGKIGFDATTLAFANPGLSQAVGPAIDGEAIFEFTPGNAVELSQLTVNGQDYGLSGFLLVSGLSSGFLVSADLDARYEDLAQFSTLAERPVSGRADAYLTGYYSFLSKGFDLDAQITGTDIALDQPQLDRLLEGESRIKLDLRRDTNGIELEGLTINAQRLTAEAQGYVNSLSSDVTATISMPSLQDADPNFSGALEAEAKLSGAPGSRRLSLTGEANDLRIGIEALDGALQGRTNLALVAGEAETGYQIETLELSNPQLSAEAAGSFAQGVLNGTVDLELADLSSLRDEWSGAFSARARISEAEGSRFLDVTGTGEDLHFGIPNANEALTGTTDLAVKAEEKDGVITLRDVRLNNDQMNVTAEGVYGKGVTDVTAQVDVLTLAPFGPGWRGSLTADASFREAGNGLRRLEVTGTGRDLSFGQAQLDGALAGETRLLVNGNEKDGVFTIEQARIDNPRLNATASGVVGGGQSDVTANIRAADLRFLGNGIRGAVTTEARLTETAGLRRIIATGEANGLGIGQEKIDPILGGRTSFDTALSQTESGLSIQRLILRNPQLQVQAEGDTASGLSIDARLADLGVLQPGLSGPVTVDGTVREDARNFVVDLGVQAPGDTRLQLSGSAARDFSTTNLAVSGGMNAALANTFLRTRSVEGPITVNLNINGAPSLDAVSGEVRLSGGELADPNVGIRVEALNIAANLQNGRLNIDAGGNVAAGGRISVSGPVDLRAGTLDLDVVLDRVVARDPNLYETEITARLSMSGRNADGPLIAGRVDLGPTEIRIPSTGLGGAKAIPDIHHVGSERPPVRGTRAKAGLEPFPSEASRQAGMSGPPSTPPSNPPRLDLQINAPNRVFIRGRGVDAEMGGSLQVQGTTRNVVPIGNLELIRGRVDLLGKRFDLTEGLIELQGSFVAVLNLVAETEQDGITTRIIIDGEVRDPDVKFESSPELPEEEVLSQLLFGRGLDNISALQAAQLANAIAVLAGGGGVGIVNNLRNQVGLDDLDLQTDDEGNVQVRAGKYLTENIYTDVSVGDDGKSTINLNLDITERLRARGSVDNEGESKMGIYFERDY